MRLCIDIDGTICNTNALAYSDAIPIPEVVNAIAKLKEEGHYIILFTARGPGTGIDHSESTRNQLQEWGVKYDELLFGKPFADFYIDDKAIVAETWHHAISSRDGSLPQAAILNKIAGASTSG
jgi:hypothetical protein